MKSTLLSIPLSQYPDDRRYSELYKHLQIEIVDDALEIKLTSRINNRYNRELRLPLNEEALK